MSWWLTSTRAYDAGFSVPENAIMLIDAIKAPAVAK